MSDQDSAAAAYYDDPEHIQLTGTPRKRSGQPSRLTTHVPVRFSATVIERVKELATADGKTVSSWIRDVVEKEILRREQPRTVGTVVTVTWQRRPIPDQMSSTVGNSAEDAEEAMRALAC
jgi:hypothetical protein